MMIIPLNPEGSDDLEEWAEKHGLRVAYGSDREVIEWFEKLFGVEIGGLVAKERARYDTTSDNPWATRLCVVTKGLSIIAVYQMFWPPFADEWGDIHRLPGIEAGS